METRRSNVNPEELCITCPKRTYCSDLCPEAECYANQDEVPQRELTIGLPRYGKWPEPVEKPILTKREHDVLSRLAKGESREKIAKVLGITRENVRQIIRRTRKTVTRKYPN